MAEILVLGELKGPSSESSPEDGRGGWGTLHPITAELVTAGRGLGGDVGVALLGDDLEVPAAEAAAIGADKVYVVEHPLLGGHSIDAKVGAFEQVCRQTSPRVVLVGKTPMVRDVAPRVAFRLGVGLAQDCTEVRTDAETGRVVAVRPVYGGNALATVTFPDLDPQMAVIRGAAYEPYQMDGSRTDEIIPVEVDIDPSVVKVRHVETVRQEAESVRLEDAAVVISGGRGLGGPEPFRALEELAGLLGGAVGASRAATDAGWIDHSYQVGLTGKTVTPDLYITFGISGASQHMAGCSGAKHIVAVNRDSDANIFKEATLGVAGDWSKVLPSFIETVRELVD